jgi:hypothetical protein
MRARKLAYFKSAESADKLLRSELWKGMVIGFFVMALSKVAPSLLVETLIVNLIGELEKGPALYKKKTFKRQRVREWSADCLSDLLAHSSPTRLFS